jgi:hypothetical protein
MSDAELIARLRYEANTDGYDYHGDLHEKAADRIEALTADLARSTRMIAKMVPLSADGNYVFWDGVGDIELDHNGELRETIEALEAKLSICERHRDAYAECDRIGTQAVRDLEAKLAKVVEALDMLVRDCEADYPPSHGAIKHFAIATLAEIKGESHE